MPIVLPRILDIASSRRPSQLLAVQPDRPRHLGVFRQQPDQRHRGGGFARAGFADDGDHLAGLDAEAQAAHRGHRPVVGGEGDGQVGHLQQRAHFGRRFLRRVRSALARVDGVAQPVADQVGAEHDQHQHPAGNRKTHGKVVDEWRAVGDQGAQRDIGWLHAEAQKAQAGFGQDRGRRSAWCR